MALTQLDPGTALLVVDLQRSVVDLPFVETATAVVERSARLARAFRSYGLPVVLITVTGAAPGRTDRSSTAAVERRPEAVDLVDELEAQPEDVRVIKQRWGAFTGTDLHEQLQQRGVTQVVLVGLATSLGVESTARSASELGYNVTVATDAMTDFTVEAHRHSIERIHLLDHPEHSR
jgi:nicotinamidase-related amidase